jgi:hypothetical protein
VCNIMLYSIFRRYKLTVKHGHNHNEKIVDKKGLIYELIDLMQAEHDDFYFFKNDFMDRKAFKAFLWKDCIRFPRLFFKNV